MTIPAINFDPCTPDDLDAKKDPSLANLNRKFQQLVDGINGLIGVHGPIALANNIDMGGNRIVNMGAATDVGDALNQTSADPLYGKDVQKANMEAVGDAMLQTSRRLNDGGQQHLVSSDLNSQGSIPPTLNDGLNYTSTTTSITWTWNNLVIQFGDLSQTEVPDGSLAVTGLSPGVTYYFYPYYDTNIGRLLFVPGAAQGSPSVSYTIQNTVAAAKQNADGNVPLSIGGMQGVTPNAGTGGGTGGGSGCHWAGMLVESRTRGCVAQKHIKVGEVIRSESGWTRVVRKQTGSARHWIRIALSNGEELRATPTDPVALYEGVDKQAGDLTLRDLMAGVEDNRRIPLQITRLEPLVQDDETVLITVDDEDHRYLCGLLKARVIARNFVPKK
jgi:hypothetical protein